MSLHLERWVVPTMFASLAVLACGCGRESLVAPQLGLAKAGPAATAATSAVTSTVAQHEEGNVGPGALYSFDVPASWNGMLVLYVHGYTPPTAPVAMPSGQLRDFLLQQGFAVAISSFSENGYAVAEGTRQSHQLLGMFADRFGAPARTFVLGVSMGGAIGLELTEKYPGQVDGSLLVSGVVGGSRAEVNYVGDIRVLWDYFYPNTIPGSLFEVPQGTAFNPNWVLAAISTPEGSAKLPLFLAFAASRGLPLGPGNEPVVAAINALGFQWVGAMDLFERTHSHVLYDNMNVTYAAPGVPPSVAAALNAGVARYHATPDAAAFLDRCYEPKGTLKVPVVTLHGARDPVVPYFHEQLLGQRVAEQGNSQFLLQERRDTFGHVVFPADAIPTAFMHLVNWVTTGNKPVV